MIDKNRANTLPQNLVIFSFSLMVFLIYGGLNLPFRGQNLHIDSENIASQEDPVQHAFMACSLQLHSELLSSGFRIINLPDIDPIETSSEYIFGWGFSTKYIEYQNKKGHKKIGTASCIVDAKSGFVDSISFNNKSNISEALDIENSTYDSQEIEGLQDIQTDKEITSNFQDRIEDLNKNEEEAINNYITSQNNPEYTEIMKPKTDETQNSESIENNPKINNELENTD